MRRTSRIGVFLLLAVLPATIVIPSVSAFSFQRVETGLMIHATDAVGASTNWSGYAVTGTAGSITLADASWVVPSAICPSTGNTYAAFWVGIDGFSSSTVEQTGTDSDCHNGSASYFAWYEFFPAGSVPIPKIKVSPGDVIVAVVSFAKGQFTDAIKDITTGQTFSIAGSVPSAMRNSAEFIAEAPLVCSIVTGCNLAQLSNFGKVGFGQGNTGQARTCGLVMSGTPGSITTFASQANYIVMINNAGNALKALPGLPTAGGSSFLIGWASAGP